MEDGLISLYMMLLSDALVPFFDSTYEPPWLFVHSIDFVSDEETLAEYIFDFNFLLAAVRWFACQSKKEKKDSSGHGKTEYQ